MGWGRRGAVGNDGCISQAGRDTRWAGCRRCAVGPSATPHPATRDRTRGGTGSAGLSGAAGRRSAVTAGASVPAPPSRRTNPATAPPAARRPRAPAGDGGRRRVARQMQEGDQPLHSTRKVVHRPPRQAQLEPTSRGTRVRSISTRHLPAHPGAVQHSLGAGGPCGLLGTAEPDGVRGAGQVQTGTATPDASDGVARTRLGNRAACSHGFAGGPG
jgi:hypothetical protein